MPELVTTIVSAVKKEHELLIGNIIGSNIFNICIVLGILVAIFGNVNPGSFIFLDFMMLIISAVVLLVVSKTDKKISKLDGFLMITIFSIYYLSIVIN